MTLSRSLTPSCADLSHGYTKIGEKRFHFLSLQELVRRVLPNSMKKYNIINFALCKNFLVAMPQLLTVFDK